MDGYHRKGYVDMRIVGVIGEIGSGKTTFAQRLEMEHGFQAMSFAAPLKRMCAEQFGWDLSQLDAQWYKLGPAFAGAPPEITRRFVLQHIGTEGFRRIDPNHWVKKGIEEVLEMHEAGASDDFVFGDVRFSNEAEAIIAGGGKVVRLNRWGQSTNESVHASETEARGIECDRVFTIADGVRNVHDAADWLLRTWDSSKCEGAEIFGAIPSKVLPR